MRNRKHKVSKVLISSKIVATLEPVFTTLLGTPGWDSKRCRAQQAVASSQIGLTRQFERSLFSSSFQLSSSYSSQDVPARRIRQPAALPKSQYSPSARQSLPGSLQPSRYPLRAIRLSHTNGERTDRTSLGPPLRPTQHHQRPPRTADPLSK